MRLSLALVIDAYGPLDFATARPARRGYEAINIIVVVMVIFVLIIVNIILISVICFC